jgi:hypothetical protein
MRISTRILRRQIQQAGQERARRRASAPPRIFLAHEACSKFSRRSAITSNGVRGA